MISPATLHRMIESYRQSRRNAIRTGIIFYLIIVIPVQYGIMIITSGKIVQFCHYISIRHPINMAGMIYHLIFKT